MSNYSELLKDPRWQKKRLKIFERDDWRCQVCLDTDTILHVHHIKYIGDAPWDCPDNYLITVCESCHEKEEELKGFDLYSLVEDTRITRAQLVLLLNHVRYRLLHPFAEELSEDCSTFWLFHYDVLRSIIPDDELGKYNQYIANGKNKIKGSAKIAQPDLEQSEVEKQSSSS